MINANVRITTIPRLTMRIQSSIEMIVIQNTIQVQIGDQKVGEGILPIGVEEMIERVCQYIVYEMQLYHEILYSKLNN